MCKLARGEPGDEYISYSMVVMCVYRDCYGLSPLKTIYTNIVHFHFQFEVDFTFNDIRVESM